MNKYHFATLLNSWAHDRVVDVLHQTESNSCGSLKSQGKESRSNELTPTSFLLYYNNTTVQAGSLHESCFDVHNCCVGMQGWNISHSAYVFTYCSGLTLLLMSLLLLPYYKETVALLITNFCVPRFPSAASALVCNDAWPYTVITVLFRSPSRYFSTLMQLTEI